MAEQGSTSARDKDHGMSIAMPANDFGAAASYLPSDLMSPGLVSPPAPTQFGQSSGSHPGRIQLPSSIFANSFGAAMGGAQAGQMSPMTARMQVPMTPGMPGFTFHQVPETPPLHPQFLSPGLDPSAQRLAVALRWADRSMYRQTQPLALPRTFRQASLLALPSGTIPCLPWQAASVVTTARTTSSRRRRIVADLWAAQRSRRRCSTASQIDRRPQSRCGRSGRQQPAGHCQDARCRSPTSFACRGWRSQLDFPTGFRWHTCCGGAIDERRLSFPGCRQRLASDSSRVHGLASTDTTRIWTQRIKQQRKERKQRSFGGCQHAIRRGACRH